MLALVGDHLEPVRVDPGNRGMDKGDCPRFQDVFNPQGNVPGPAAAHDQPGQRRQKDKITVIADQGDLGPVLEPPFDFKGRGKSAEGAAQDNDLFFHAYPVVVFV